MNRIYQGRVTKVEIFAGKDAEGKEQWNLLGFTRNEIEQLQNQMECLRPLAKKETPEGTNARKQLTGINQRLNEPWRIALWEHHQFFQDAVNYYILALASLADPEHTTNRLIKDLRVRVAAAWVKFPRAVGEDARCLRKSLATWLDLSSNATLQDAFEAVLNGNEATAQIRTLALALLLDRCGGESAIQQGGRGYLPRFCDAKAKPTYDYSSVSQAAGLGKNRLSAVLHGDADENEIAKIAEAADLSWTVKLQPGEFFTPEESSARLVDAIEHVRNLLLKATSMREKEIATRFQDFDAQFDSFKAIIETGSRKFVIPRNRKASKDLTFATLTFKFFPCPLTAKVLSLFVKKPKAVAAENPGSVNFASCGDDPIKLARGSRGFVFRAFTALPAWNPKSPGEPVWKEFDIAAFKEALKSLNQFNQNTQERIDEEYNLRGQLAIMLSSEIKGWKPRKTETNEDEPAPESLNPKLFQLARELECDLTQDLADTLVGEEMSVQFGEAVYRYREGEWQLSSASLRGFRDIAEEWNTLYAKFGEALATDQLEDVVKKYQREEKNKNSIGSVPLFLRLCERKYWPLWLTQDEDADESSSQRSFLACMVLFHTKIRDFKQSLEPINLTPAEPRHSRRLYMFSDLTDKKAKVVFGKTAESFTVECAVAMRASDNCVSEQRVRLFYSAKRLLRDELQGGVESRWLQPMTRALGLKMPESPEQMVFESAVSLMPDFVHSGEGPKTQELRFLLNFPVTLDPTWIHSGLGKAELWKGQFNGTRDKNLHLHWPGTMKGKGSEAPWWKDKQIVQRGFTCISVDLGQRSAGAWALLRVTCSDPRKTAEGTHRPVREIGCDGERTWFAEVLSTGILRLPGEDQRNIGSNDKLEVERFGKSGRSALESEWSKGKELASNLLAENPEAWLGKTVTEKSFPEQNDALIALANRRLSRLNTFHRWSCFDPDRPEIAARRSNLIKKLAEELEHWQHAEVVTWKNLIAKEDFAGFRSAAGAAFDSLRFKLGEHLVTLANRVAPLRDRSWYWDRSNGNAEQLLYGQLLDTGGQLTEKATWIRGQRGLSLARIEQLENLRRLFLRYNRSFDREAGKPATFGHADLGRTSGEPCKLLLEKIDRMKEQRVNQTAHFILAEALGVRLKTHQIPVQQRKVQDIHGEYEKTPGREPVDFIVIENLDRYLTSQGRAPSENSRLMKWAHRAVREKIKMLAEEPFGIPVVETAAAYSSRFCAITGAAGARCEERAKLDDYLKEALEARAKRPLKPGQPNPKVFAILRQQFDQLEKLNHELQSARSEEGKKRNSLYTLFVPKQGGPLFLSVFGEKSKTGTRMPRQADVNAAINIGLRGLAAPNTFSILHKVRAERDGDIFKPLIKNAREKATFDAKSIIALNGNASNKLAQVRSPNFFFNADAFDCFDSATLKLPNETVSLASSIGLWTTVNQMFPCLLAKINDERLERWRKEAVEEDDVKF